MKRKLSIKKFPKLMYEDELSQNKRKEVEIPLTRIPRPPHSFPYGMKNKEEYGKFSKFMVILKQLLVYVQLIKSLEKILGYAKFMKDLVIKNRTVSYEPVENLYQCSVIATRSLFQKKKSNPRPSLFFAQLGISILLRHFVTLEIVST